MKVLVLGASGATGLHVVTQLLKQNIDVKAVVRGDEKLSSISGDKHLGIIKAAILDMDDEKLEKHAADVDGVISCLGHNLSFKGIFGPPHYLVTDALDKLVGAVTRSNKKKSLKLILMNTTGCLNREQKEKFSRGEAFVMGLVRALLPPQRDNESALAYLFNNLERGGKIEWLAVRPDTLINEDEVSEYSVHPSVVRSPIFNAGKTSRINVAAFMAGLIKDEKLWEQWKYKTPVIYNKQ